MSLNLILILGRSSHWTNESRRDEDDNIENILFANDIEHLVTILLTTLVLIAETTRSKLINADNCAYGAGWENERKYPSWIEKTNHYNQGKITFNHIIITIIIWLH